MYHVVQLRLDNVIRGDSLPLPAGCQPISTKRAERTQALLSPALLKLLRSASAPPLDLQPGVAPPPTCRSWCKFPTASFTSSRIAPQTQGTTTHIVTGDLTMKGIKKTVTFPATISLTDTEFSAKAEFTINRKDWGIVYPGKPDDLIRDGVVMNIDLKGVR